MDTESLLWIRRHQMSQRSKKGIPTVILPRRKGMGLVFSQQGGYSDRKQNYETKVSQDLNQYLIKECNLVTSHRKPTSKTKTQAGSRLLVRNNNQAPKCFLIGSCLPIKYRHHFIVLQLGFLLPHSDSYC